jgi:putative tricarboxylic transport membrane protein
METLSAIINGFSIAIQPINIFFCFVGVFLGTLVGVLPGIGPLGAIALLFPSTYYIPPVCSLIMFAGIYYGAMYGGSTTSILLNIPGEVASIVTCLDGYQMARKGRAGAALGIAAFGSFIAGTISVILLGFLAPPLAGLALKFGPPEYTSLMVLGFMILVFLARGSIVKAFIAATLGLILGLIGTDVISGHRRFTFGIVELNDGISLVPVVMGLFGISEILINVEEIVKAEIVKTGFRGLLPNVQDWKDSTGPILRGSFLGFFLGILPGATGIITSFTSYVVEKKISKHPEKFGTGAIEGVAGPESANNSGVAGAFIPLLTLGIPSNPVMALMLGALIIYGLQPGPLLMREQPNLFWGLVTSMYIGNAMLLVLNLPLIGIWVKVLKIRYSILFPLILLFCLVGAYSINNSTVDVWLMLAFGIFGYLMRKFEYDMPPLILALVLGPIFENSLRQSLILFGGNPVNFMTRPLSAVFVIASCLILLSTMLPWVKRKKGLFKDADDDI